MFRKLLLAIRVLKRGEELRHAATWKTVGAATAALTIVLPDALNFACQVTAVCFDLTPVQMNETASAIAHTGVGLFILYTIFGTSKKVGL